MKRRVLSFILTLALCLNLCPVWAWAADAGRDGGLCPHHLAHTDACGYVPPSLEGECTHSHGEDCYRTETDCIHEHTDECNPESGEPVSCGHTCTQDSGCITRTLSCAHKHDAACGYHAGNPGAPCTFACQVCPIEDLIGKLPHSVSADNSQQVQAQISEIYALYDGLTQDEQQQVDLSPCVSLLDQIDGMGSTVLGDAYTYVLPSDMSFDPYVISSPKMIINTNGHTLSGVTGCAIQITSTGELTLKGEGKVTASKGAGVEVQSGGILHIAEPNITVSSTKSYALDIAAGATVQLSAGKYTGRTAAIQVEDGDFARLLAPDCAYFDTEGNPISTADVASAKTVVVNTCTNHAKGSYTHNPGNTEHTWSCSYCGTEGTEQCTFSFAQDGTGTCVCGNALKIVVDEDDLRDLVYDGTIKPTDVTITVTLTDGSNTVLVKGTDYKVEYVPRADAGDITVTVTGVTFNGTFTKTYQVSQDRPALEWDTSIKPVPVEVEYDGEAVEAGDLPPVKINIQSTTDNLQEYLQYSHKKTGDTAYTDGLPTNAGTYEVIVSLPEMQNFEAAVSAPITLTVQKISPIDTAPEATQPVFNGIAQALVTSGTLRDVAVRDGVVIKFSTEENGPYDTTIPTGTNAGQYTVWYQTDESENYTATPATQVQDVKIQRKQITPVVTLSEYKYLYDGGWKEPTVTVRDEDHVTILLDTEYQVRYVNNKDVSTEDNPAKVIVTNQPNGNYDIEEVEVPFQITSRTQETLSINNKPNTVIYGDQFTLETSGGSGNGDVTWEITGDSNVATVDPNSGQVTIIGNGSATVKATKSGTDPDSGLVNYEDAIASWTFTAVQKPVTATVVAENKFYDGSNIATITAVVEQGVLPGDVITIQGLTGTFQDANAGEDKTVTVDITAATVSGNNSEYYKVSYSSTTVKATIYKAIAEITTPPVPDALTYNGAAQALIATGAVVDPNTVQVEYALSQDGPYTTDFPKATNAGTYTVWYRVQETDNYTGLPAASVEATIAKKPVAPAITLDQGTFVYDGTAKEPAVTLNEVDGMLIPDTEYTVEYSNNVNVGTATVTVTAKDDGNYSFTTVTKDFTISQKQAQVITAPVEADDPLTYNTRDQKLVTPGEGSGGTMVYSTDNANNAKFEKEIPTGRAAGEYTVYYKVEGDANHSDSAVGSVKVTIAPKVVNNPVINLSDENGPLDHYTYDGTAKKPTAVVLDGSTLIDAAEYNIVYNNNIDAGTATVNLTDKPNGNYIVSGSATFVIVKADIAFSTDPAAASITYDGKAHELLIPGETSGGEVQYALNSATSTYTAAIPTATEAGNYTVYYKVVGDKNHNDYAVKSIPVTIQRKPLTDISIELTPDSFVYDGQVKLPEVTVKFTEGKTETVVPKTEYDWSCNNTAPTDEGTYTITISDATGGNYDLSNVATKTATFTIGKIPQNELVIEGKPATTNYGDSFQLTVSGSNADASGAISWSAEGPATVNQTGEVTITGVGEVTITVKKAESTNYFETQAQWSFTATPKPVTASITVDDKLYDGTTSATVTGAMINTLNGDTVTIDPASITATFDTPAVGTGKTVTLDTSKAQVTGDVGKYAISYPDTVTAAITQETTKITKQPAGIASLEYNGQPQALVKAGETNVGFLVYSLDGTNFSPEVPTGTNAGAYTVHYKVDGTADYTEVAVANFTVTIQPKRITPTVTPSTSSFLYDGTKKEPVIVLKDGKTVIDEDQYTVTWKNDNAPTATDVLTDAGTYTATIKSVTGGNYSFTATAKATITKAAQSALKITGKPSHVYYGDTVTTLDTTGGSGNGTVTWSIETGGTSSIINPDTGELTVKDTGSITVKAERTVPNYETVSDTWTFTVEPKPVTAVVTVTGKVYDGNTSVDNTAITAQVKASDLVATGDTITISGLKGTYDDANVGTDKTVTLDSTNATVNGDTGKYTVSYPATAKADITPKAVTVTVTLSGNDLQTDPDGNDYYVYNGGERTPTVTVTADDGAVLAASDYSVSYSNNQNVGTATVTVTNTADGNYTFPEKEENFDIREADAILTSTPRAKDLTYNGTMQDLVTVGTASGGTVVYSLVKDGTDTDYTEAIPQKDEAGTYTVYYMVKGDANHGDTTPSQVSVTIKPKEVISPKITVTGSYTYDGSEQKPAGNNVTVEDGSTTIPATEYTLSYQNNINAGTAMVIVINANGGNYIVNGTATFEIAKASAGAAAAPAPQTLKYNGTVQELVTAGSASNGTMVYSLDQNGEYSPAIPTGKDVGNYTVWYKVKGDDNHNDSAEQSVSATITKNTVTAPTIQVTPETVTYNGKQQTPKVSVKDDQGVAIDGSEYTVAYADDKGNTDLTAVGEYTLTITEVADGNYIFDKTNGKNTATFEILPAGQTPLTITGTREHVYYGDTIPLGTTGGNGTVTWDVGGSTIASITTDGRLTITGVGPVTVTATSTATGYNDQTATWPIHVEKKPVTAVVTAAAKTYDGTKDANVTATLQSSDLVGNDIVTIDLPGSLFEDANAGTDKKVNVNSKTPNFTGSTGHENYNITYPATTTASIFKADIDQTKVTAPAVATGLTYTGKPLALVTAGSSPEGTMEYSLDDKSYSVSLPTGTDAGDCDVWYRVKGDSNHNDTAGVKLDDKVTIAKQEVTAPIIEFIPSGAAYNGSVQRPVVVVKDANGRVIPDSEYTVAYGSTDWTNAGDHEVTVTGKTEGNYNITTKTEKFTITPMGQNPLSITNQPGKVQYGDSFTLSAIGGSGTGTVVWQSSDPTVASIDYQSGLVTTQKAGGPVTITATKQGDVNFGTVTASWTFCVEPKPVTPIVTAKDREYDPGNDTASLVITWKDGDLLKGDSIMLTLSGNFDNPNAGNDKQVTITGTAPISDRYEITLPTTTTASITPKAASVTGVTVNNNLIYNGSAQALVSGGTATGGDPAYSQDGDYYTLLPPKETNAGTYPVWYKAKADNSGNYTDSPAMRVDVTIQPKSVTSPTIELSNESFEFDGTEKRPDVVVKDGNVVIPASEYTVSYSNNVAVGNNTAKVTINDAAGGNYTVSGSRTFTIKAGEASLETPPEPKDLTYTGSAQALVTPGTAVNGRVLYSLAEDGTYTATIPRGTNAGDYEVWYQVEGNNGASDTEPECVTVTIKKKQVTPTILLNHQYAYSTPYTGSARTPDVTVIVDGQQLPPGSFRPIYSNNKDVGTATVTVQNIGGNYQFFAVATFEITKGKATFLLEPEGETDLVYTGEPHQLVGMGAAQHGLLVLYSLDGVTYSTSIPTGTDTGDYIVFAKVQGNAMYEESDVVAIRVKIGVNNVTNPGVALSSSSFHYTGGEHKPTVTVTDDRGNVIPASEYTVSYRNNINVGPATVTVTSKGSNYRFTAAATFEIVAADQSLLTITGKRDNVYYGDMLQLGTTGGSGNGAVNWTATGPVTKLSDGQFKITNSGSVTITATKAASGNYAATSDTWTFYANPKPVTATVMAEDKTYDGGTSARLTVTINSGLVSGDFVTTVQATGHFTDANVGQNKTVIIDSLTIPDGVSEKYDISYNVTTTASITPKAATVTSEPVKANNTLTYNGSQQNLLTSGGTADGGDMAYSLDGKNYSFNLPTAKDAGNYTVWYKVVAADENHKDSVPAKLENVVIAANADTPTVLCTPATFQYDGTEKTPAVVVRDSANRVIPESEYTVTLPENRIAVNTYTVTVKDNPGGNYVFSGDVTGTFEIVAASQNPLSIVTDKPRDIYYGDSFRLSAMGGSGNGAIHWSIEGSAATISTDGVVTISGTGGFTVKAYREAADGYSNSNTDSVPFVAHPKPVTPVVTAKDKPYDGNTDAELKATWKSGDLVGSDKIDLTVTGEFVTADVGTNKQVEITSGSPSGDHRNYSITWPDSTTASISRVDAKLDNAPAAPELTYTGTEQALVTAGTTVGGIGTIEYSLSQNGVYSTDIPKATNAGKYTVWYKVADSVNYMGIPAALVEVEIKKATPTISTAPTASGSAGQTLNEIKFTNGGAVSVPGTFAWKDGNITAVTGTQYDVIFTPDDTANYNAVTFQLMPVTPSTSGGGTTTSAPMQTTVQNGAANTVLSTAGGRKLVSDAIANQSESIVIKPEITGEVTKAQVSIPSSTVSQIKNETNASLTVSVPIADVTIPNTALDTLGSAGGTVNVMAEQVDQSVVLKLTADGKNVESVPGGVKLTVPAEDAGPGTVAVLVHEDGTREIVRKSLAGDGKVDIPLNGSATVEIVDNSKEFADVPDTNWAADAVDFASAHEMFNGTSETTFSPDETMSRGMLATVLYNLEGCPEQEATGGFGDVSSDDWYADSIAWAVENGIADGYGDGQFGPNDNITREQLAVILWKYAGSPKASGQDLAFTDADQASGYAQEALCWAVEKGILNGYNGQLSPRETATRAQAAQMLKSFMENA